MKPTIMYYTLAAKVNGKWCPIFGAYDKPTVKDEREDVKIDYPLGTTRIIKTGDSQAAIDAGIAQLNELH